MFSKILVVDDEADLELLITQKFRREIRKKEIAFEFAGNGHEAIRKLKEHPEINLVLTDINMPEMDGLSLLAELKAINPIIRAIVISAYGDMENIRQAMNRGAFDFLTKPIDFEDLKITLGKTIQHVEELKEMARAQEDKRLAQENALEQERKAQEAQRKLISQLKKEDKLKDEFLASTSHELRTPLNGIIGLVESLLDGVAGDLNDVARKNLDMVVASGKRLSRLVDDILDFSKMRNEGVNLDRESLDLKSAVDLVLALSQTLAAEKSLKLVNQIPADFNPVLADANRLEQVLFNLVGNAVKFTEQGTVTVSAELVDDMVQISVMDTGIGIPDDQFEDIFKMFRQVENSSTRVQGGAGLGLAITKNLIELQGGSIQVRSKIGEGSCFYFTLPRSDQPPVYRDVADPSVGAQTMGSQPKAVSPTEPAHAAPAAHGHGAVHRALLGKDRHRILVVDDEPVNQQVLANHLSLQNYAVVPAMDGFEALRILEEDKNFDLIILDVMMPGMSGYEVCQTIRGDHSLYELPVLMLTAKNQAKDHVMGLESGANDYVTKPFDKRELLARVDTLISLKEAVHEAIRRQEALRKEQERTLTLQSEKTVLAYKAQEAARAEAEAKEASRKKTDFLALMSHELRTPLNAIIGYSEILHEEMEESDHTGFIPDILKIQNSGKNLLSMINNLLDLTKIEAGKMDLYVEEFQLSTLFSELESTIHPLATKNGNVFGTELVDGLEDVRADVTKLRQVLLNLLGNACKFTRRGSITLVGELSDDPERIRILVRDTGIGMNAEQVARIFKPYTQANKSTSRNYGGTGLGLVITKRFCEMMDGNIGVESELGKGTTFWIELPRYSAVDNLD